jgi:hypothetical protein
MISSAFSAGSMMLVLSALHFPSRERPSIREFLLSWKVYLALVFLCLPSWLRIW